MHTFIYQLLYSLYITDKIVQLIGLNYVQLYIGSHLKKFSVASKESQILLQMISLSFKCSNICFSASFTVCTSWAQASPVRIPGNSSWVLSHCISIFSKFCITINHIMYYLSILSVVVCIWDVSANCFNVNPVIVFIVQSSSKLICQVFWHYQSFKALFIVTVGHLTMCNVTQIHICIYKSYVYIYKVYMYIRIRVLCIPNHIMYI